jgi:hypothetical protein
MDKFVSGVKGMTTVIGGAAAVAWGFNAAFDQAMDFGRAGAELDYAEDRFTKLATSIGTTADALKGGLKDATRGMVSDSELVGSAASFMALGLAKSYDEVVRLTRVAGALGMDMNQLVLTLTNQTTMRFDALGVSVDGFDAKVKALKDTGMDANKAFTEAFLQQAEDQINRVGDAADSATAAFTRMEVAQKNMEDAQKRRFAPALATVAETLTKVYVQSDKNNTTWMKSVPVLQQVETVISLVSAAFDRDGEIVEENTIAVEDNKEVARDATREYYGLSMAVDQTQQYYAALNNQAERSIKFQSELKAVSESLATANDNLSLAYIDLRNSQQNWMDGAGGDVANVLESAGLKGEQYRDALGAIDEVYGTGLGIQQDYKDDLKALTDEYKKTGDIDTFKTKLNELKDTYMPLNEQVKEATDNVVALRDAIDLLESKKIRIQVQFDYGDKVYPGLIEEVEAELTPKALGGPVMSGAPYLVGEQGPELFVPSQSGQIIPNGQASQYSFGGGVTFYITGVQDPDAVANIVIRKLGQSSRNATASGMAYKGRK